MVSLTICKVSDSHPSGNSPKKIDFKVGREIQLIPYQNRIEFVPL